MNATEAGRDGTRTGRDRSAVLRATHALLIELSSATAVPPASVHVHVRILETLKGTVSGQETSVAVPIVSPTPPLFRPGSPWEQVDVRDGTQLLALAETDETSLPRVLVAPALRSLWPGAAADDARAVLAAEPAAHDAQAVLAAAASRRSAAGPLFGEWVEQRLLPVLTAPGAPLAGVRTLLAAPDASPALRESLVRALFEASLWMREVDLGASNALARELLEGALRPDAPEPFRRRIAARELRALLLEARPPVSAVALLPDAGSRERARTALAGIESPDATALAAWLTA